MFPLTPELLLRAYAIGVFPMARSRGDDKVYWIDPDRRGIIPLERFHLPRRLRRTLRSGRFRVTRDRAFAAVLAGCAEVADNRPDTWINEDIARLFTGLHRMGLAHSVECWREERLVGGLYGLAMGGAFFGESMFSRERDASKVALCHLVAIMKAGGFTLLDTQFITDHLRQLGACEIPRNAYLQLLGAAMKANAVFQDPPDDPVSVLSVSDSGSTHSSTQTS